MKQPIADCRREDRETHLGSANVKDDDQVESSCPEPVPNASSVWSVEELNNPDAASSPSPLFPLSSNVHHDVGKSPSKSQVPAEGTYVSNDASAENVAAADIAHKTQRVHEKSSSPLFSTSRGNLAKPSSDTQVEVEPVKAEASGERNTGNIGWSWGHENEIEENPSHAISAWGHFDVGVENEQEEDGTSNIWNADFKEEPVLPAKEEIPLQSSVEVSSKKKPDVQSSSLGFKPAETVDEQREKRGTEDDNENLASDWNWGTGTEIKPDRLDPFTRKDNESTEVVDQVKAVAEDGRDLFVPQKPAVATVPQSQLKEDSQVHTSRTEPLLMDSFAVSSSEQALTGESIGWGWGVEISEEEPYSISQNPSVKLSDSVRPTLSAQNDAPDPVSELPTKKDRSVESAAPADQDGGWDWSAGIAATDRTESSAPAVLNVSDAVNDRRNSTTATSSPVEQRYFMELRTKDSMAPTITEEVPPEQSIGWDWNSSSIPSEQTFGVLDGVDSVNMQQTSVTSSGHREAPTEDSVPDRETVSNEAESVHLSGNDALRTEGHDYAPYVPHATTAHAAVAETFEKEDKLLEIQASQPSVRRAPYDDSSAVAAAANVDAGFSKEDASRTDNMTANSNMVQEVDRTATAVWPPAGMSPGLPNDTGNEYSERNEDTSGSGHCPARTGHFNINPPEVSNTIPTEQNVTAIGFHTVSSYAPVETTSGAGSNVHSLETVPSDPFATWATSSSVPEPVEWSLSGFGEDTKPENTFNASDTKSSEKPLISTGTAYRSEESPKDAEDYSPAVPSFVPSSEPVAAELRPGSSPNVAPQSSVDIQSSVSVQDMSDEMWRNSPRSAVHEETGTSTEPIKSQAWNPPLSAKSGVPQSTESGLQGQSDSNNFESTVPASSAIDAGWNLAMSYNADFPNAPVQTTGPSSEYSSSDVPMHHQSRTMSRQHLTSNRPSAQETGNVGKRTEVGSNTEAAHDFKGDNASGFASQFWADKLGDPVEASTSIDRQSHNVIESSFSGEYSGAVEKSAYANEQKQDAGFQTLPPDFRPGGEVDDLYAPKPLVEHSMLVRRTTETQGEFRSQNVSENTVSQDHQSPYPPSPAVSSPLRSEIENPGAGFMAVDDDEHEAISYAPQSISTVSGLPAPIPHVDNEVHNNASSVFDDYAPPAVFGSTRYSGSSNSYQSNNCISWC